MSIWDMSLSGGTMILVTALVRLIAREHLPRRAYVALWMMSILRLLVPLKITFRHSVYGLLARTATQAELPSVITAAGTPTGFSIWPIIGFVGMAVMGVTFAVSYIRCILTFRGSLPMENEYIDKWLLSHPFRWRVEVRTIQGLRTPLTYGFFCPVILLPAEAEGWESDKLDMILCHEYTHIKRFDGILKLLAILALCVHWWNPAVWLMVALLDRDIELACDGEVVDQFGPESRARYAHFLIDLKAPESAALPVAGFGQNVTEKRIRGVMSHKQATRIAATVSAILVVNIVALFATAESPQAPETVLTLSGNVSVETEAAALPEQAVQESNLTVEDTEPENSISNTKHYPETMNESTKPIKSDDPIEIDSDGATSPAFIIEVEGNTIRTVPLTENPKK